jgi:hypothetical protein
VETQATLVGADGTAELWAHTGCAAAEGEEAR